jgi:hypothetical protein
MGDQRGGMMPCDYSTYHPEWKRISRGVIKAAGNRCALCYAPNGVEIVRSSLGGLYPWTLYKDGPLLASERKVPVVLTVHHINGNKKDNSKNNLIALCQRCHLKLDMAKHVANRRKNKLQEEMEL